MRLYWEVAKRAFQRQLAYRTANLAGLTTNAFFGYVRAAVFVAAFHARGEIAGYDLPSAITYTWITQALIMVVMLWGWWDVATTITTGQVVSDLSKPFSYLGFWLARDAGRALYFLLFRAVPVMLVGELLFDLRWPSSAAVWLLFGGSLMLANVVCFGCRFLINLTAFWLTDAKGVGALVFTSLYFLSGLVVPLRLLPEGVQAVALALPFAGILQTPADVFLERVTGVELVTAVVLQAFWAAALMVLSQVTLVAATRRLVVQGG